MPDAQIAWDDQWSRWVRTCEGRTTTTGIETLEVRLSADWRVERRWVRATPPARAIFAPVQVLPGSIDDVTAKFNRAMRTTARIVRDLNKAFKK